MAVEENNATPFVYFDTQVGDKISCNSLELVTGKSTTQSMENRVPNTFQIVPSANGQGTFRFLAEPLVMEDIRGLGEVDKAVHITTTVDGYQAVFTRTWTGTYWKEQFYLIDQNSQQKVFESNLGSNPYTDYVAVYPVYMYNITDSASKFSSIIGLILIRGSSTYGDVIVNSFNDFKRGCYQLINIDKIVGYGSPMSFIFPYRKVGTSYVAFFGGILKDGTNSNDNMTPNYYDGDPNSIGGNSGTDGGKGNHSDKSDPIDIPDIPTYSGINSGFINLYAPTLQQLKDLATYLWSSDISDIIKKMYASPMESILGLSIVPVLPMSLSLAGVGIANVATGVEMYAVTEQYTSVYCGFIEVKEFWGSALDYSPYTKIQIYLPYIGIRSLNADDVMGKKVEVVYRVDVLTGSLTAFIKCDDSVLYQFSGNCSSALPISGKDFTQIIQTAISATVALGTTVATGGTSAPITASTALSGVLTTAGNVANAKPQVQKSGSMGGTSGLLGQQTPYLIIERPRQSLPVDYKSFVGYPSNITSVLSALKGYTEIESVHLEGVTATDTEKTEILKLLQEGVIL